MNKYTKELVAEIASHYQNRRAFKVGHEGAYRAALRNGWLDDICAHMTIARRDAWTKDEVVDLAQNYSRRREFEEAHGGAYDAARRKGWLDEACAHMPITRELNLENVTAIAKKFKTRTEFHDKDLSAYEAAMRNGWLNIVCDHMKKSNRGFDVNQPGILYQLEFTFPNGDKAWKVGITNGPPSKRISSLGVRKGVRVQVSHVRNYIDGAQAAEDERQLHREFKDLRYKGLRFLSNGHTEVYSEPLIG
jgi:hypothetical protein